jgi:two-component system, NarL family, sensor kinase
MSHKLFKFDSDTFLSQALLYLLLAGYIALVYAVVLTTVIAGGLAPVKDPLDFLGQPWGVNIVIVGIVALTLRPVHRWLKSQINVLIYGQHDDPYVLISQVNQQLQTMASPQSTLPAVAQTIAHTLKLPYLAIEIHHNSTPLRIEFGRPPTGAELTALPLLYLDKPMGELHAATRRANEALSEGDVSLLRDVAQQIGIALHAAQLTAELQASRERLVMAREEERRRIRNDLHDGLAPTLSSVQMQLGAIRNLIQQNPAQAEAIANDLRDDLRQATAEIRQLVYDLRPPMLDELGLVGAIKSFRVTGTELHFEVIAPEPMPALSAAVEVAVYRIVSEAVHNVIKHAQATACVVCIEVAEGRLSLSVTDNGRSFPAKLKAGVGLHSMKERAAEVGGTFSLQPGPDGGLRVTATLPLHG